MGDVFDRWRLNQGWNPWDNSTQEMAIASWCHTLDLAGVPYSAYSELYERVLQRRASAVSSGKPIPNFGVELMLAEWEGEYGLRAQLREHEIDRGRTLTGNAESQCDSCYGTGRVLLKDDRGRVIGTGSRCGHDHEMNKTNKKV